MLGEKYKAPYATDVFVDNGDVMTDKKLGLERLKVSVTTKQTLPALICRNYFICKTCIAKARNCHF